MNTLLIIELILLGIGSGFLAGLLGIGGGMVLVPFLTYLISAQGVDSELAVKMAIATSMAVIIFTSVSSVRAHHKRGAVRWDIVRKLAPGIVLGSMLGSIGVFSVLKGAYLAIFFGIFVAFSATQMFLGKKPPPTRQMPGTGGQLLAGGFIGFLSGLVGAGGGFISVPFMTWCNVAIHTAVATSAALGFPIAVANVAGYIVSGMAVTDLPPASFGYIYLPALALIAAASVCTAPLGARAAHSLPVSRLKRVFAIMLYALAIYMFMKGINA
ncbi:sulfite exporter TauE/SafE family protein [Pollutimonas harenae]|uniref:Probable membrane transporter protein n=1 Tax=Pollutimonas harenae TaxID=657015 RepID=A0A853H001_9BURK|nr:sulfite exporter TauE/SafE family protein [Pollutimonas harenae]NYT85672.1 sulfite exporter TauE/SafE family protein [Pollutimonas harenae]TEA70747.1 sulfite exporter TauE/SafE family protein [Pollutimonas harenae]